ncbi:MAG: Hsp70 family protein [Synergistaceae bacterium]|nr:Hsp70 family protein [Synergistaceae bacterium]
MSDDITVGIDLGTRYAQIAIDVPGRGVTHIPNRWGGTRTPSMVAFSRDGLVAGEDAARIALADPANVWWDMKRNLGTEWVARVGGRAYTPEELLLPLLVLLREDAEANLKVFISSCVLAAPAHFSFPERGAMTRAARMAGFERVRIVNEPTAAALSVGINGRFLIIDFGAGTLDLSMVEGDTGVFQVMDSRGRRDIGGLDIDRLLAEFMCRGAGVPISRPEDPRASLMMREAEAVKIALSGSIAETWRVPAGLLGRESKVDVSRADFELLIGPLMEEIVRMVESMWRRYTPERLLLIGGSGRIPLLRRMLAARVREPDRIRPAPEDAVVTGSALYANQGRERLLIDVLSRSLGVMNADGGVVPVLSRGTPLPAEARRSFTALGSGSVEVTIVQGEGRVRSAGRILQTISAEGVSNGEAVEVLFKVDGGGLLHVEVRRAKGTSRRTIALESDELGTASCDISREIRARQERLVRVSAKYPDNFQQRLRDLTRSALSLKNEDSSLQWQALEVLDRMISELERVTRP